MADKETAPRKTVAKTVSTRLEGELYEKLEDFRWNNRLSMADAVRLILSERLNG